jgi:hypothetical protein
MLNGYRQSIQIWWIVWAKCWIESHTPWRRHRKFVFPPAFYYFDLLEWPTHSLSLSIRFRNYFIASVVKAKSHERWRLQCSLTAFQMDETSCSQSLKEKFRRCIWQVGSWKLEWFARRNGSILSASSDSFSTSLGRATRKFTTSSCARGRRDGSCNETIATIAGQHASECPTSLQHRQSRRLLYKWCLKEMLLRYGACSILYT